MTHTLRRQGTLLRQGTSLRARRGQHIIDYLVVSTAVIAALVAVRGVVTEKTTQAITTALNRIPVN